MPCGRHATCCARDMASKIAVVAIAAPLMLVGLGWYTFRLHRTHSNLVLDADAYQRAFVDEKQKSSGLDVQLATCLKDRAEATTKGDDAAKSAAEAKATITATKSELEELRAQRAEAEARAAAFKQLTEKLKKMIDSGKLKVELRNGRMIVKLPAGILFASGSADLSSEGNTAIGEVAAILKQFPDRHFEVAGHTDNVPLKSSPFKDNWELSTARAVNVTERLIAAGLNPSKLVAAGYGQYAPLRNNTNEAGRQENRRIEIVLLPNIAELPSIPTTVGSGVAAAPTATTAPPKP
jgi:chemotaxis protein MotB